jgi:hypothetical protein
MNNDKSSPHLSIVAKLSEGYVILCSNGRDEYSFLAKTLGISIECPHCGATQSSVDLAQEYFLGKDAATRSPIGVVTQSHHVPARARSVEHTQNGAR